MRVSLLLILAAVVPALLWPPPMVSLLSVMVWLMWMIVPILMRSPLPLGNIGHEVPCHCELMLSNYFHGLVHVFARPRSNALFVFRDIPVV